MNDLALYKELGNKYFTTFQSMKFVVNGLLKRIFRLSDIIAKDKATRTVFMKAIVTQNTNIQGSTSLITDGEIIWRHIDPSPDQYPDDETIKRVIDSKLK